MPQKQTPPPLVPVLLGADMNCYSVARAFHEAYGVASHAFGRWAMGETKYSRIVRFTAVPHFDTDAVMADTLLRFAAEHPGTVKIALGCTDDYAALLIRNRERLSRDYIIPYVDEALLARLSSKADFYALCEERGVPYPDTAVLESARESEKLYALPFAYPVIIKPSSSVLYWKHEFDGMKKVYAAASPGEAEEIVRRVYASGYPDKLIVQDTVPGPDDGMRVLTAYCGEDKKVRMMCLGHVLLEEHTPRARGNHAAIITEYDGPLMQKLKDLLEAVGYTGFANFDIKYDARDGVYKVFELNLRQGRSNYYVTGAGLNIARWLVEDRVRHSPAGEALLYAGENYWHSIPNGVVWRYTADEALVKKAKAIAAAGRDTTALGYPPDLRFNPLRRLYLWEHYRRYAKKYADYCPKPERG